MPDDPIQHLKDVEAQFEDAVFVALSNLETPGGESVLRIFAKSVEAAGPYRHALVAAA